MSALSADCLQEPMPDADTTPYSDDEARWAMLMVGAQSGDKASYHQLLSELAVVIERYLVSRLGRHDLVEDCVQEVLIAVHKSRHTYDVRRAFRPWLFAIVRHKTVDTLRRGESRKHVQLLGDAVPDIAVTGPDSDLSGGQLMAGLPAKLRDALVLTKIHGFSGSEAAQRLGISEAALKVRVHRAMGKIKKMLETEAV